MKIGAVCEQTGLSDRTVRFYTDEGLLNPSYTKNYLGRKTFDFSEADVAMLKCIAVLRKYGFSIPEIKAILEDPAKSVEIIAALREKKQTTIQTEQELLDVLLTLESDKAYTVPELAEALTNPRVEAAKPVEEPIGCLNMLSEFFTKMFWLFAVPPMPFAVLYWLSVIYKYLSNRLLRFPPADQFWPEQIRIFGYSMIPFVLAAAMVLASGSRCRKHPGLRCVLTAILALCIGPGSILSVFVPALSSDHTYEETEDPAYYMQISGSMVNDEDIVRLFPLAIPDDASAEPGRPYPDTTQYYFYWDNEVLWQRYEVFAQWPVSLEALEQEKRRIQDEFADSITRGELGEWEYWSVEMDPAERLAKPDFNFRDASCNIYLFVAWNEERGLIRYIAAYSDDVTMKPAFLELDWD